MVNLTALPVQYVRRVVDAELDELLPDLPALSLEGPKGIGKTLTAVRRSTSIWKMDHVGTAAVYRADPTLILESEPTILIDEWQRVPTIWDAVRRAVDDGALPGRFLLTGSAAPKGVNLHSGAGRIVTVRMRPMALSERLTQPTTVSLTAMLDGANNDKNPDIAQVHIAGESAVVLEDYVHEIVASGFPAIAASSDRARKAQLDGYISRVIEAEFPEQGIAVRRPETLRGWLDAYAGATGTTASYNSILFAATPGLETKPAKTTVMNYRDGLSRLWLLDDVPAWTPSQNTLGRLGAAPKHFLADSALAARLMGYDESALLGRHAFEGENAANGGVTGRLFEALVTLSVKTYAQAAEARVSHFREHTGAHEVDLIVHRANGSTVALEIKLSADVDDRDVRHLLWLKRKLGADLTDMAVIYTGKYAYRRPDGVAVIPAALLGP